VEVLLLKEQAEKTRVNDRQKINITTFFIPQIISLKTKKSNKWIFGALLYQVRTYFQNR
jgi:hypothetical protein